MYECALFANCMGYEMARRQSRCVLAIYIARVSAGGCACARSPMADHGEMSLAKAMAMLDIPRHARPSRAKIWARYNNRRLLKEQAITLRKKASPQWRSAMHQALRRVLKAREEAWGKAETNIDGTQCNRDRGPGLESIQLDPRIVHGESQDQRKRRLQRERSSQQKERARNERKAEQQKYERKLEREKNRMRKIRKAAKKKATKVKKAKKAKA